ncbi:uncharacterized protein N7483_012787 [Penicillium malachiteum]|uniref:uncharacterized protein n=1 Tax=Penicillium malachiteum TaxID=1324776 RepID=UPI0025485F53|nr:uncharacterized protein N7483_012787 [Penicillium malachiteum]KAJ5715606.1 hypothetical protein N7483_012787 [Penicillium malachiteum]
MSYDKDRASTPPYNKSPDSPPPYVKDEEESRDRKVKTKLKYEDLDLEVSYVGKVALPEVKRGKKQVWHKSGEKPIIHRGRVPPGWNDHEPDLDLEDYDAQIKRCDERIQEGIMPAVFEWKKEEFQLAKAKRDEEFEGLQGYSLNVARRIKSLEQIVEGLEKPNGDYFEQICNAKAILLAYRYWTLDWNPGLVTYWSKGERISEPRPFVMKEFNVINLKHEGSKSFWVEGIHGPGPVNQLLKSQKALMRAEHPNDFIRMHDWSLRLPGMNIHHDFEILDDTGCDDLSLRVRDMALLQRLHQDAGHPAGTPALKVAGAALVTNSDGTQRPEDIMFIEANFKDENGEFMTSWDEIICLLANPPGAAVVPRLSGPWLRYKLYTASAPYTGEARVPGMPPPHENCIYIFDQKSGLSTVRTVRDPLHNAHPPNLLPGAAEALRALDAQEDGSA